MKRIMLLTLSLSISALCLCGCVQSDNQQPVETSIVYVYTDSSENASGETTVASSNTEATTIIETTTENTKASEPISLRKLNMLSGAPDINGMETIATGETFYCIGMTIDDIEKKQTLRRSISYPTQGNYSKFTCSLALMNDSSKNSPLDCFIEVYCDGVLTYTSESISRGKMPIKIETDISGAETVEIKFCVTNNLDRNWQGSMWASNQGDYLISFAIAEPEFWN